MIVKKAKSEGPNGAPCGLAGPPIPRALWGLTWSPWAMLLREAWSLMDEREQRHGAR